MIFDKSIRCAEFVRRPNRFQGYVLIDGKEELVHVPNTGRCREILVPGCKVLLREENGANRKTRFTLIAAYKGKRLINIDSQAPNKIVEEALKNKKIDKLCKYKNISKEKVFGKSRFDFKLFDDDENEYYLEVKGVTLESDGHSKFPDAPTERGKKHVMELIEVKKTGRGAGIIFLIQMDEIKTFTPNDDTDKDFGDALRIANENGVDIFAYSCKVDRESITLDKPVEIIL